MSEWGQTNDNLQEPHGISIYVRRSKGSKRACDGTKNRRTLKSLKSPNLWEQDGPV